MHCWATEHVPSSHPYPPHPSYPSHLFNPIPSNRVTSLHLHHISSHPIPSFPSVSCIPSFTPHPLPSISFIPFIPSHLAPSHPSHPSYCLTPTNTNAASSGLPSAYSRLQSPHAGVPNQDTSPCLGFPRAAHCWDSCPIEMRL